MVSRRQLSVTADAAEGSSGRTGNLQSNTGFTPALWKCAEETQVIIQQRECGSAGAVGAPGRGAWSRLGRKLAGCWRIGGTLRGGSVSSTY